MQQPKTVFTALVLAGLSLAACKPGAAPTATTPAAGVQANPQGGLVVKINDVSRGNNVLSPTASDDPTSSATATAEVELTDTPEADDDQGLTSGLDSTQDIVENSLTGTPETEDVNDDQGGNSGQDSAQDIAENGTPTTPVANLGQQLEFTGTITAVGNGFIVVGGQTVWVGAGTEVKGTLAVGATVKVHAFVDGNGALSAREIEPGTTAGVDDNGQDNSNTQEVGDDNGGGQGSDDVASADDNSGSGSDNSGQGSSNNGSDDNSNRGGDNSGSGSSGGGQDDGGKGGGHG